MASSAESLSDSSQGNDYIIPRDRNGLYGLHISSFDKNVTEQDLQKLFQTVGRVHICKIVNFKGIPGSPPSRVAFVKYKTYNEALAGLQRLNGTELNRRKIVVNPALVQNETRNKPGHDKQSTRKTTCPQNNPDIHPVKNDSNQETRVNQSPRRGSCEWSNGLDGPPPPQLSPQQYYVIQPEAICQDIREMNFQQQQPLYTNETNRQPPNVSCLPQPTCISATVLNPTWTSSNGTKLWSGEVRSNVNGFVHGRSQILSPSNQRTLSLSPDQKTPLSPGSIDSEDEGLASVTATLKQLEMSRSSSVSLLSNSDVSKQLEISHSGSSLLCNSDVTKWSVSDVMEYLENIEQCSDSILTFIKEEEINGKALVLLDRESLMPYMKLGPALNLLHIVARLKDSWLAMNRVEKNGNIVW